jgi:ERCC4-type nuclease
VGESNSASRFGGGGSSRSSSKIVDSEDVEQKKLQMGDFAIVLVDKNEEVGEVSEDEDAEQGKERVLALVERKTINDLCGRSQSGDHLRQISRIKGSGIEKGFLLLEGDPKSAANCTVW